MYVHKACLAVFKGLGVHDFEIHHGQWSLFLFIFFLSRSSRSSPAGKDAVYNIVAFARESVRAHVTTLRPDNFPSDRKEPWLVDFFAPVSLRRRILQ